MTTPDKIALVRSALEAINNINGINQYAKKEIKLQVTLALTHLTEVEAQITKLQRPIEVTADAKSLMDALDKITRLTEEVARLKDDTLLGQWYRMTEEEIATLKAENEKMKLALERIVGMSSNKFSCVCGRVTGVEALKMCASAALTSKTKE